MTDGDKIEEWVRYLKACITQDTRLATLAHMDLAMRTAVFKKLRILTAQDVFDKTREGVTYASENGIEKGVRGPEGVRASEYLTQRKETP